MDIDLRNIFLNRVVKGKSFADVGGVWGTVNEKISVSRGFGAASLTMIDMISPESDLGMKFQQRMRDFGIDNVKYVCCDFQDYAGERFDVVHSAGVLYHLPNPFLYLKKLRATAREHVILTSLFVPEKIENLHGRYEVPGSAAVFIPGLTERERMILHEHFQIDAMIGVGSPCPGLTLDDFAANWWLPTTRVMRAMCAAAGFDILDEGSFWDGRVHCLLLAIRPPA